MAPEAPTRSRRLVPLAASIALAMTLAVGAAARGADAPAAARMKDLRPTDADLDREMKRVVEELRGMYDTNVGLAAVNRAREHVGGVWFQACQRHGGYAESVVTVRLDPLIERWRFYRASH